MAFDMALQNGISEDVRQKRREAYEHARISLRLDGLIIPEAAVAIHESYINGEITSEQRFERLRTLYPISSIGTNSKVADTETS